MEQELDKILEKSFSDIKRRVINLVKKHEKKILKDQKKPPKKEVKDKKDKSYKRSQSESGSASE
jgi:hypothetical protein